MNRFRISLLVGLFLLLTCFAHSQVKYGTLTVKDNQRLEHWPMYLSGTWQLYIDKMLPTVEDVWIQPPDAYIIVPGTWNYTLFRHRHSVKAVCTYRMNIKKLKPSYKYAFYMKDSPRTAVSIYCNGKFVKDVGTVCEDLTKTKAMRQPLYAEVFSDQQGNLELVFQVSNYNYRKGGLTDAIRFGEAECVFREFCRVVGARLYFCANLFVLALYNLMLFLLDKKHRGTLYFALFILTIAMRIFVADCPIAAMIFPNIPFSVLYKVEYFTLWASPPFFVLFCRNEFPHFKYWKITFNIVGTIGAILGVCCTLLPIHIANHFVQALLIYSFSTMLFMLIIVLHGLRFRNRKVVTLLVDIIILLIAGTADIIITKFRIISPIMIMPYAMMIFAAFQFFCISLEQSRMFAKHKVLVAKLEDLNEACVRFVPKEFLRLLHVQNLLKDVYLGNHVDVEMSIVFSKLYFEEYDGCVSISDEEKTQIISRFFQRVSLQIADCGGFISKFIGQGFMALFPGKPEDAIECCEVIVNSLDEINIKRQEESKNLLRIGMGVHYGKMILGMIGEEHRLDDTVISDTVNTASRIESYAEKQGLSVVVSETLVHNTPKTDRSKYYPLGEIKVKGKVMPLLLSEYRV